MKINVMNADLPYKGREWYLNPATVCLAEHKRCEDGSIRYLLHTMDGGVWEVTMEDYMNVVAWIKVWIERD
jgi:hypothetical protein